MGNTYCRAEMKFIDVTALSDAKPDTEDNQPVGSLALLAEEDKVPQKEYGTLELNQFILNGSKEIMQEQEDDIAFWSKTDSKDDCTFEQNPKFTVDFSAQHSSAGLTLYFEDTYPAELIIRWYTAYGTKIDEKTFFPNRLIYVCVNAVQNFARLEIEFVRTILPHRYIKLQYILYGRLMIWDKDRIKSAKVQEEIDVTSASLSINEADITILDEKNDFDVGNEVGAWKSVQKTQEIILSEFRSGSFFPMGTFFLDDFSFSKNLAQFKLIDSIGLMDKYTFYDGEIYENTKAGVIMEQIFAVCGIKKYSIQKEVYDIQLSGYLAIQSCRDALKMICFACGAVADDSRSDTVKICKPDRYVKSTVGLNRKFNGNTKVALDEYVSGVSIECGRYVQDEERTKLYEDSLPAGISKIIFSDPCRPESLSVSDGEIVEAKTNYATIKMQKAGKCILYGKKYQTETFSYEKNIKLLEAGETENRKSFGTITLYNMEVLQEVAEALLSYYSLRKTLSMKYLPEHEKVGNWADIETLGGHMATTLIEKQTIDLAGGFVAVATCRGYSTVVTQSYYAGKELYAGGAIL